jgi:hypothetical protein
MTVDLKSRDNQLNLRRNLSGIYFFTLCFYTYYFFTSNFYTYNIFNLLKSPGGCGEAPAAGGASRTT